MMLAVLAVLEPIERPLTSLLEWLHGSLGLSWAWSIVALTIIVRMALVPLTVRQIHSMQAMQAHMPEMKAIQQRYKNDRQKKNEELMKFYRENKINPAASCLPILFQIPIFISLFFVLKDFEKEVLPEYPGSDLHWLGLVPNITDAANSHWTGYLLLALYATSQTASTLLMSQTMDKTQRTLMLILPIAFLFVVLNFPSGLVIYWVTTNLWTVGQGLVTRGLRPKQKQPPKRTSRTPPKERAEPVAADGAEPVEAPAEKQAPSQPRRVKRKKKRKAKR
ncbi:MAG TPA: YidC/Oxa1 family membrane protein insertase [Gaiellaceae bacterium]|jgi:YidC/Oxa1 family membrane protein insertase|nr:YidC/Oxa1 family membrane protein insertase [Gaiellaceae bacterium]